MRLTFLAPLLLLSACAQAAAVNPLADPRERGPFRPTSHMPIPPNVERAADSAGCAGEPLQALEASLPDYPARGWSRGLQGWSIVQFDVEPQGRTLNVRIARGVPGGSFDTEARRAVRNWRFHPLSGDEILTGCTVMFEFRQGNVTVR